jgi:hypothetical protein
MTPNQRFAVAIRNRMFATQECYADAIDYAYSIAKGTDNPAAVMTAVMVVVNTLAKEIEQIVQFEVNKD